MNRFASLTLRYVLTLAVCYFGWKALSASFGTNTLPTPEAAVGVFLRALPTAEFWGHFNASAFRAASAMFLAWIVGFPLGVLMGGSRKIDAVLSPFVLITYPIPKIVLLPLALIIFGLGDSARVFMIALILGYQVLVTTRDGVRNIHPGYLDSIRSMGATRLQRLTEVLIPAGLPGGFTALRLNAGVSVAVLFFVESFATRKGLGYLIMDTWGRMAFEEMFAGILGMSLLGVLLYECVNLLERKACAWQRRRRR